MAIVAEMLRRISAKQDAYAHAIQQAARASRSALIEAGPSNSIRNVFPTQTTDAAVRLRQTAETLDSAVEALELMAAGLWST